MLDFRSSSTGAARLPWRGLIGASLLALLVAASLLAPWLSPFDPLKPDYRATYAPPSTGHLFGTDNLGRDVWTRALYGGRTSLVIALSGTALALAVGAVLGTAAAGVGGVLERVLTRLFDALLAFPGFLLVLLLVAGLGGGVLPTLLALGVAGSPLYFRLARAYTRSLQGREYVKAAQALGAGRFRVLVYHVVPNFLGPVLVQAASTAALFLIVEASLSYLGLGVQLPTPSWGNVLQDARAFLTRQPWAALGPGIFLAAAALSFQLLADALQQRLDVRSS